MLRKKLNCFTTPASLCITIVCTLLVFSSAAFAIPPQDKKVIEYGWDWAYLDQIANPAHLAKMEKLPFDGICFRISKPRVRGFSLKPWKDFPAKKLKSIKWHKFTDNFISFWPAAPKSFNWYNDAQWKIIEDNARLYSKAVKLSSSVGIFFDPEAQYGNGPAGGWKYTKKAFEGKSYSQVAAQLRKRGQQFMKAIASHKPDIKILAFVMWQQFTYTRQALNAPPSKRVAALEGKNVHYSLWLPFLEGMMQAAGPKVQIIDGNEWGYYDISAKSYAAGYKHSLANYKALVPAHLRAKMMGQMQIGMPIYMDQPLALRIPTTWQSPLSQYLSPEKRVKLFGYQLYQALNFTDQYVWVYSERMKWWPGYTDWKHMMINRGLGKDIKDWSKPYIPKGVEQMLHQTIKKYKSGKPININGIKLIAEAKVNKAKSN